MERRDTVRVDLVREDLVIQFSDGKTALLHLQDIYDLATARKAFVVEPNGEDGEFND